MPFDGVSPGWTEARIALLKKSWADGLSASQIAKQLGGVSRNACIGKVHRLGLAGRATPSRPTTRRRVKHAVAKLFPSPRAYAPAAEPAPLPPLDATISSIADLKDGACAFPIGDPKAADFGFCGRECEGRWCAAHRSVVYVKSAQPIGDRDAARMARYFRAVDARGAVL